MDLLERVASRLRHAPLFGRARFWNTARPLYDRFLSTVYSRKGLARDINGTDRISVLPRCRGVKEVYEPEVWVSFMSRVRPGDRVVDVGAYVGLYAIAAGKRLSGTGEVVAFEPDAANYEAIRAHIRLNGLSRQARAVRAAVGAAEGKISFLAEGGSESHVLPTGTRLDPRVAQVECVTLDGFFHNERVDLLKIDVEGHEEAVLKGASRLLTDTARRPRFIYVEVHPYAWPAHGTTSASLLSFLASHGYRVTRIDGTLVSEITAYGEILAFPVESDA